MMLPGPEEYADPLKEALQAPRAIAWILRLGFSPAEIAIAWPNGAELLGVAATKDKYMLSEESQNFLTKAFFQNPQWRFREIQRELEALGLPEKYLAGRRPEDVTCKKHKHFANYFKIVGVPSGFDAMVSTKKVIVYYGFPVVHVDESTPEGAKFHDLCEERNKLIVGLSKLQDEAHRFFCLNPSTEWEKLWPTWQMCVKDLYLTEAPSFSNDNLLLELKNDTRYHQSPGVNVAVAAFLRNYRAQNAAC